MTEWTETFRGTVAPWECDLTEHFTVAYYLDRIDQAAASIAEILEVGDTLRTGGFPRRLSLRFTRELRAGDSFHIESAALGLEATLRLGHRIVDFGKWRVCHLDRGGMGIAGRLAVSGAAWRDRPTAGDLGRACGRTAPEPPAMTGAIPSARGLVKPADLDEFGRFAVAAFVHRFTDALLQATAAIGMTSEYQKQHRRGFSTFELALRIVHAPRLGEPYLVETGIAHLGASSIRLLHRMSDPRTGYEFARLGQFGVQLDLDARRPSPLPEDMRARAAALLLPAG